MNAVTSKKDFRSFRVYIDDNLHLELLMENYDGMQSWLEGTAKYNYFIQYYKKVGEPMICEYDDKDIWLKILKEIDNNL